MFRSDFIVTGIAPMDDQLVLLAHVLDNSEDAQDDLKREWTSFGKNNKTKNNLHLRGKRLVAPKVPSTHPELHVISWTNEVVSR